MITIDGSTGEGGGQVLRTSLALSMVTGQALRIANIRAGREKPGLLRQHLTAVRAAAEVCGAKVSGDAIGSQELVFEPKGTRAGAYRFAVGTAGSATLVLQTVLPALMLADGPSELTLEGGTHNPWAPPFDFIEMAFVPLLGRMGPQVSLQLERPGFYPAGGGRFTVSVQPIAKLKPLELVDRGEIVERRAKAIVSKLSTNIARRELKVVQDKLGWAEDLLTFASVRDAVGPGNIMFIEIASQHVTEVFTGFGQLGKSSESVACSAVDEARQYMAAGVPVGPHLADQLLVPMAMVGSGRFRTVAPTRHTTTNIEVIQKFMDVGVSVTRVEQDRDVWEIGIRGCRS